MVSLSSAFVKSSALSAIPFLTLLILCGALRISPVSAQPQTLSNSAVTDTGAATSQRQTESSEEAAGELRSLHSELLEDMSHTWRY